MKEVTIITNDAENYFNRLDNKIKQIADMERLPFNVPNSNQSSEVTKSNNNRSKRISFRVTPSTYNYLKRISNENNIKLAEQIRDILGAGMAKRLLTQIKYVMPGDINILKDIDVKMLRVGNNLNQIAHANNYFNKVVDPYDIIEDGKEMLKQHDKYAQSISSCQKSFDELSKEVDGLCQLLLK